MLQMTGEADLLPIRQEQRHLAMMRSVQESQLTLLVAKLDHEVWPCWFSRGLLDVRDQTLDPEDPELANGRSGRQQKQQQLLDAAVRHQVQAAGESAKPAEFGLP